MIMAKANLTPTEVTSLCTAGEAAYAKLGHRGKEARFTWNGNSYVAKRTSFRLCIDTPAGDPVACKYD